MMKLIYSFCIVCFLVVMSGCGYTTTSLLPPELDSIHVQNFTNEIDLASEVSDRRASFSYRPGLETDITRKVIDEFIFDRHLDINSEGTAALTLKGALIDFRQYPLSYDKGNNVVEFRIEIKVNIELYNNLTGKELWRENNFMGQSTYSVTGPNAITEGEALKLAVKDLADRIVELTVEGW